MQSGDGVGVGEGGGVLLHCQVCMCVHAGPECVVLVQEPHFWFGADHSVNCAGRGGANATHGGEGRGQQDSLLMSCVVTALALSWGSVYRL